ncbi:AGAP007471-PA-like protein [Anopheles sinensis]|uniref:AGAP007471-PA-like protein n=1 Tax=Anopheles sinensis TaxID=74873 RepID=A0A084WLF9_ANOSI|nr:AGAP007471-PA-like protein [Anopheles sinensis]
MDLSDNKINLLIGTNHTVSIETLNIAHNRLTSLDLTFFGQIANLSVLYLVHNQIIRIDSTTPVKLLALEQLMLSNNQLTWFQPQAVSFPALQKLFLNSNNITFIPRNLANYPALEILNLRVNKLTRVDLSSVRQAKKLVELDLSGNKITSLSTPSPLKHDGLQVLIVDNNELVQVNFTGCTFPNIRAISLAHNRLTSVPSNVFQLFPTVLLYMYDNPTSCDIHILWTKLSERFRFAAECVSFVITISGTRYGDLMMPRYNWLMVHMYLIKFQIENQQIPNGFGWYFLSFLHTLLTGLLGNENNPSPCTIPRVNTTDNGWAMGIVAGIELGCSSITIENVSLPAAPGALAAFIQVISSLTVQLVFEKYYERGFNLTKALTAEMIRIGSSSMLEEMQIQPNVNIRQLTMLYTSLTHLPEGLRSLPKLDKLETPGNRLSQFSLTSFSSIQKLSYVDVSDNRITNYATLTNLELRANKLTRLDLSSLRNAKNLSVLALDGNRIASLSTSSPIKNDAIVHIGLDRNQLQQVNFSGCNFPNFRYLFVRQNQLTSVPLNVFQQFPSLTMYMSDNPLRCQDLAKYKQQLVGGALAVDPIRGDTKCLENQSSSIKVNDHQKICCTN